MDLETAKLVAFALWAESNEGVIGKNPTLLRDVGKLFSDMDSLGGVLAGLGEDLLYKWDNYLTVWEAAEEPEAPAPEEKEPDIVKAIEGMIERVEEIKEGLQPGPLEAPLTLAEADEAFDELESASTEEQKETPAEEPVATPETNKGALGMAGHDDLTPIDAPKKQRGKRAR